jgi:L-aminopeptidase/D-esterase-like protein
LWIAALGAAGAVHAQTRARDLGVPFEGGPGPRNAITDVAGVEAGHATIISGQGKLEIGKGPVRTGVTAIWPRGRNSNDPVFGGWFSLNGNGEMTGTAWLEESGFADGPILITNTHSVGVARDAYIAWLIRHGRVPGTNTFPGGFFALPIVAETYDGFLNDTNGMHVKEKHVVEALEGARSGPVAEGNVGGGTGMMCYGFKGGIGTSSRRIESYTVAALVQCNCGQRRQLTIAGVPVGMEIPLDPVTAALLPKEETGSIIIVIATDAPLLPHQLKRLARRASMGLARTGATSGNGSGDLFLAFSTANPGAAGTAPASLRMLPNDGLNGIFEATVQSTEEAIVNAMVGAESMTGVDNHKATALPHGRLRDALKKYNRLR